MKKNKQQRLEAKAASNSSSKEETVKKVKDAVNVSSQEKAKSADEPVAKKKKKSSTTEVVDKSKKESLDNKTALAVTKAITEVKDLKYVYPADVDTLELRKKFRAEVRRKVAAAEKEIAKLQNSKLPEDIALLEKKAKEFDKYAKKVYVNPKKAFALS